MSARTAVFATVATILLWLLAWAIASMIPPVLAPVKGRGSLDPVRDNSVVIAPHAEALTFARFERGGKTQLMLVEQFSGGTVTGVDLAAVWPDLAADPVNVFTDKGYEALEQLTDPQVTVAVEELMLPFDGNVAQIAVGINYPEHGKEVTVGDSFIFPKQTAASQQPSTIAARRGGLLDYELELGFVALQPIGRDSVLERMGLVLASDFTDRATLMRRIDIGNVSSGAGFTEAKSVPGFMPVGNLFVIPKDLNAFYKSLTLKLWLNGDLRQVAEPAKMTWDIRRIVAETFARQGQTWLSQGTPVGLPIQDGTIPARTIFLSGTPDGVIFQPPSARQIFLGVSELVFTLQWTQPNQLLDPFIREELASGRYLRAGDEVVMHADRLGALVTRIVDAAD